MSGTCRRLWLANFNIDISRSIALKVKSNQWQSAELGQRTSIKCCSMYAVAVDVLLLLLIRCDRAFQSDRLVKIFVGQNAEATKPFLVQQVLLENLSPYFTKALRQDGFREGKQGSLTFPDDDRLAWEILLYWIVKREVLWLEGNIMDCISCWALGDKYGIVAFQDEAMLELLRYFNKHWLGLKQLSKGLEFSPCGSKMRLLLAEEIVYAMDSHGWKYEEVEEVVDGKGLIADMLRAQERFRRDKQVFRHRLEAQGKEKNPLISDRAIWTDYLTSQAPVQHWVYTFEKDKP